MAGVGNGSNVSGAIAESLVADQTGWTPELDIVPSNDKDPAGAERPKRLACGVIDLLRVIESSSDNAHCRQQHQGSLSIVMYTRSAKKSG